MPRSRSRSRSRRSSRRSSRSRSRSRRRSSRRDSRSRSRDRSSRSSYSSSRSSYPSSSGGYFNQGYSGGGFGGRGGGGRGGGRGGGGRGKIHLPPVDWSKVQLVPFQKDFYQEHPNVSARTPEEVKAFRLENRMNIEGRGIPNPVRSFEEACFPEYLLHEIKKAGFTKPTPIQCQGWPMALSGRDMIGIAETGSGKTLSFVLPGIVHINAQPLLTPGDGPIVLILSPTRELAQQTMQECTKFGYSSRIKYSCVYGGVSRGQQCRELRNAPEIVIATPGRLLDLLSQGVTNLRRVTYLVLDEADRMLDMGFEDQIRQVVSQIRHDRQTLLWSATWPKEIRELSRDFTKEPIKVTIGSDGLKANDKIKQVIKIVNQFDKRGILISTLREWLNGQNKVLVFVATKRTANDLFNSLHRERWPVVCIHGDKKQFERDQALGEFRSGRASLLIATDVLARGVDVPDITLVINYDFPSQTADYVHRIGRTGRAGKTGTAITFFTSGDSKRARELIPILVGAKQEVPPELQKMSTSFRGNGYGNRQQYGRARGYNNFAQPGYRR